MGVRRQDYVLIGARIDIKHCTEEFKEKEENEILLDIENHKKGQLAYLYDDYNGEYFVVGIPLEIVPHSYAFNCFEFSPSNPRYVEYVRKVQNHIEETFNEYVEPRIIVLSHLT